VYRNHCLGSSQAMESMGAPVLAPQPTGEVHGVIHHAIFHPCAIARFFRSTFRSTVFCSGPPNPSRLPQCQQGHCQGNLCGRLYANIIRRAIDFAPADASGILAVGGFGSTSVRRLLDARDLRRVSCDYVCW
jgi:hypothetical protein